MVFETIAKLLADRLDCEVSEIKAEDTFHDLGIDSLDTVDLLMNLRMSWTSIEPGREGRDRRTAGRAGREELQSSSKRLSERKRKTDMITHRFAICWYQVSGVSGGMAWIAADAWRRPYRTGAAWAS